MGLSFLPEDVRSAVSNLNYNYISEIRLRRGQPVSVEYKGEFKYLTAIGVSDESKNAIVFGEIAPIINRATGGCIYDYAEQMKSGFITVKHGIRIGIAGEYVTQGSEVKTIRNITSLNIRIPHNVQGCSRYLIENLFFDDLHSTMLYSKPGLGKTTMLRDLTVNLSANRNLNILVFDERNEIAAIDREGNGFDLGKRVDVIRCHNKKSAISSAIRAMKPDVIITDELYGEEDIYAVQFASDCGICVMASSHFCDKTLLQKMPFEFFVKLTSIGGKPIIYDKNFNTVGCRCADDFAGNISFGK